MSTTIKLLLTVCLIAVCGVVIPVARADQYNQATQLTFSQPVQVPGRVLPAGTYWFVLADDAANRNIVHIFNSDRSTLYATVETISAERPVPTNGTAITFADGPSMQQNAIVTWFYPARTHGHEFVYPKPVEQELGQASHHTVTASDKHAGMSAPTGD